MIFLDDDDCVMVNLDHVMTYPKEIVHLQSIHNRWRYA